METEKRQTAERAGLAHCAPVLPRIAVLSYDVELNNEVAFIGRASKGVFRRFIVTRDPGLSIAS